MQFQLYLWDVLWHENQFLLWIRTQWITVFVEPMLPNKRKLHNVSMDVRILKLWNFIMTKKMDFWFWSSINVILSKYIAPFQGLNFSSPSELAARSLKFDSFYIENGCFLQTTWQSKGNWCFFPQCKQKIFSRSCCVK